MEGCVRVGILFLVALTTVLIGQFSAQGESKCINKSDLVFIIDSSTSVTEANYKKQLEFTKDLLQNLDIDSGAVRVGVLVYSTEVKIQFHLNKYSTKGEVFTAVDRIPYFYGSTNTADALETMQSVMFAQRNGDRPDVPNTCIVITDGISNINSRKTIPNAEKARLKGIHIFAVGIGLHETRELEGIASVPASLNSFNIQNFEELKGLVQKTFSAFCPATIAPEQTQDFPPVSDAGDDIDIQLPDDTVTLNGNKSADDIKVVRYQWEIIAGDKDSAVSEGMDTAYPELSGLKAGLYTLKLTVYDQLGQMDEDNVDINVKDADQKCQCSERLFKIEQETQLARTALENMEHTLKELVKTKKNT